MASNKILNPCVLIIYLYWSTQFYSLVLIINLAPYSSKILTCSFLLTMFNNGIPSLWQYLFNIFPKAEAAAVLINPFGLFPKLFHFLYVSTIPITVKGFTIPEAADYKGTSESTYHIFSTSVRAYYAHVPV